MSLGCELDFLKWKPIFRQERLLIMSKSSRNQRGREAHTVDSSLPSSRTTGLLTLVGVGALLVMSIVNWTAASKFQTGMSERLTQLDNRISQVSTKVDSVAKAQQPQNRGPDPNRIYTIKTDGAPAEGPSTAPVLIAEISDFQ